MSTRLDRPSGSGHANAKDPRNLEEEAGVQCA